MTRLSKKGERRGMCPKKPRAPQPKTGPKKDNLPQGYRPHKNAIEGDFAASRFIPKI